MDPITPQPDQSQYQAPMDSAGPSQLSGTKHFLNKKFAITFVILSLLGAGAYAGIWYWQDQQVAQEVVPTFTPRPSTTPDPTADWKTYTNTQYGFEFKYPAELSISETTDQLKLMCGGAYAPLGCILIELVFADGSTFAYERFPQYDFVGTETKVLIDGREMTMIQRDKHYFIPLDNNHQNDISFINKDGNTSYQLFLQILSTFKFTDSVSLTGSSQVSPGPTVINRTPLQIATANSRRVADLSSARTSLEIYSDSNSTYPISSGTTAQARWSLLGQALVNSKILSGWMQDPNQQDGFSYDYRTSSDQKSFVIKAVMESEDSQASKIYNPSNYLQYMNRGIIFGMDCNGFAICITIMKGDDGGYK